jgi:transposase
VKGWPDRVWAIEGATGTGLPLAQRLLEAGERVVDVPPKLSARARLFDTGHNRKTDALDAHSIAVVAVRTSNLRVLKTDPELEALRMLTDRRETLTRRRVQTVNRLQRHLAELIPGTGKRDITVLQAKAMLATVRPRDLAGKTRRRIAAEELTDLIMIEAKVKKATAELKTIVAARGSRLMSIYGVGPVVAARILADVGDVGRFADRNRFASWTGTAPIDASSGQHDRHRLSRAGNRRMNHMIHIAAVTQIRNDTNGQAYYRRKRADGKKPMEAMRCLKRRISDAVYRQLIADAERATLLIATAGVSAGPGGHCGASQESSAVDLPPHIDTSDQPLPGPAHPTLPATDPAANPHGASAPRTPRQRAGAVKVQRPTGRTTLTATSVGAHSKAPKPRS